MDRSNKYRPRNNEEGVALITVVLVLVLVVAIGIMAFNISEMDSNLASLNRRTTQSFTAAGGGADLANSVILNTMEQNAIPAGYPATVTVTTTDVAGTIGIPDFVERLDGILGSTPRSPVTNPDVTITAMNGQTVQVNIDYEGPASLPGSELDEFGIQYHRKTGGTGCGSGILYYIDSVGLGALNTQAEVMSAYYHCQ